MLLTHFDIQEKVQQIPWVTLDRTTAFIRNDVQHVPRESLLQFEILMKNGCGKCSALMVTFSWYESFKSCSPDHLRIHSRNFVGSPILDHRAQRFCIFAYRPVLPSPLFTSKNGVKCKWQLSKWTHSILDYQKSCSERINDLCVFVVYQQSECAVILLNLCPLFSTAAATATALEKWSRAFLLKGSPLLTE